jgi:hypothetical protein
MTAKTLLDLRIALREVLTVQRQLTTSLQLICDSLDKDADDRDTYPPAAQPPLYCLHSTPACADCRAEAEQQDLGDG